MIVQLYKYNMYNRIKQGSKEEYKYIVNPPKLKQLAVVIYVETAIVVMTSGHHHRTL